jgi:hypothetical protein
VQVFRQEFTIDAAMVRMPARLSEHSCDQWHPSQVFTPLTSCHCKLRPNTEGPLSTWQLRSTDMGETWSDPTPLAQALGVTDGAMPGPGRALQLKTGPKAGRLLFCGHKETNLSLGIYSSYQSPIWTSDDGGNSFTLQTTFPRAGVDPFPQFGPHEGNLVELGGGHVLYEARNNFWVYCSGSTHSCSGALNCTQPHCAFPYPNMPMNRFRSMSTDSGETWTPLGFDATLSDKGHGCQGSMLSQGNLPSNRLYFSRPWTAGRTNMTVWVSNDGGQSWPRTIQVRCSSPPTPPPPRNRAAVTS